MNVRFVSWGKTDAELNFLKQHGLEDGQIVDATYANISGADFFTDEVNVIIVREPGIDYDFTVFVSEVRFTNRHPSITP